MATLTRAQVTTLAQNAGFTGNSLLIAVAIAQAESSFDTTATHTNTDGSVDRGLWQINSSNGYDATRLLSDPAYNASAAYAIYRAWNNTFNAWTTYTSGAYTAYTSGATVAGTGTAQTIKFPWLQYPITHGYITQYIPSQWDTPHYACDLGMPMHTPITSMVNGRVRTANYQAWGGQIFITPTSPTNGGADWYVYHLDVIQVNPGDTVTIGQQIGLSGGQNSGGSHPVPTTYSSGPHTHTGWFTKYVNLPGGTGPYGPDITPQIDSYKRNGASGTGGAASLGYINNTNPGPGGIPTFSPLLAQVHETLVDTPGFYGIALALDEAEQFPGFINLMSSTNDMKISGIDTGIDPIGFVRSILATVTDNFVPFLIRSGLFLLGFLLVAALLLRLGAGFAEKAAPVAAMIGGA
jgi:murein DD-endopeptidase MepM/ murein hydrolase activator NlpD